MPIFNVPSSHHSLPRSIDNFSFIQKTILPTRSRVPPSFTQGGLTNVFFKVPFKQGMRAGDDVSGRPGGRPLRYGEIFVGDTFMHTEIIGRRGTRNR